MSDGRNVIPNRETSVERLLGAVSTVSDVSLEQALDTDTREQYEALAERKWIPDQPAHVKLFKVLGTVAAGFFLVVTFFGGLGGSTSFMPGSDGDLSGNLSENLSENHSENLSEGAVVYRVLYDDVWYQGITDPTILQAYGLPETVTDEVKGGMVTYLAKRGVCEYYEVGNRTHMYLYSCKDREDVYILHDRNQALWVFVVPVEE